MTAVKKLMALSYSPLVEAIRPSVIRLSTWESGCRSRMEARQREVVMLRFPYKMEQAVHHNQFGSVVERKTYHGRPTPRHPRPTRNQPPAASAVVRDTSP